jgi:hypothetical protein
MEVKMEKERLTKREVVKELNGAMVKRLANNTFEVIYPSGIKVIRYHHTDIITFNKDKSITLNSGGWKTLTTKERINAYSPIRIYQENKVWYVSGNLSDKGVSHTFKDGVTVYPNGRVKGAGPDPKKLLALNKSILKYVNGYIEALINREIPKPSGGDCWGCYMRDEKTGKGITGNDHLLVHMKEKYYVPSLVMNAIEVFPVSIAAKSELGYLLGYHDEHNDWGINLIKFQIRSSLRRYLQRQLGLAG